MNSAEVPQPLLLEAGPLPDDHLLDGKRVLIIDGNPENTSPDTYAFDPGKPKELQVKPFRPVTVGEEITERLQDFGEPTIVKVDSSQMAIAELRKGGVDLLVFDGMLKASNTYLKRDDGLQALLGVSTADSSLPVIKYLEEHPLVAKKMKLLFTAAEPGINGSSGPVREIDHEIRKLLASVNVPLESNYAWVSRSTSHWYDRDLPATIKAFYPQASRTEIPAEPSPVTENSELVLKILALVKLGLPVKDTTADTFRTLLKNQPLPPEQLAQSLQKALQETDKPLSVLLYAQKTGMLEALGFPDAYTDQDALELVSMDSERNSPLQAMYAALVPLMKTEGQHTALAIQEKIFSEEIAVPFMLPTTTSSSVAA